MDQDSARGRSASASAALYKGNPAPPMMGGHHHNTSSQGSTFSSFSNSGVGSPSTNPVVTIICSTNLQCARVSEESLALLGFYPNELLERSLFELVHSSEISRLEGLWSSLIDPVGIPPQVVPAQAHTVMETPPASLTAPAPGTIFVQESMRLRQRNGIYDFYSIRLHLGGGFGADLYDRRTFGRAYIVASLLKLGNDASHPEPAVLRAWQHEAGRDSTEFRTPSFSRTVASPSFSQGHARATTGLPGRAPPFQVPETSPRIPRSYESRQTNNAGAKIEGREYEEVTMSQPDAGRVYRVRGESSRMGERSPTLPSLNQLGLSPRGPHAKSRETQYDARQELPASSAYGKASHDDPFRYGVNDVSSRHERSPSVSSVVSRNSHNQQHASHTPRISHESARGGVAEAAEPSTRADHGQSPSPRAIGKRSRSPGEYDETSAHDARPASQATAKAGSGLVTNSLADLRSTSARGVSSSGSTTVRMELSDGAPRSSHGHTAVAVVPARSSTLETSKCQSRDGILC